MQECSSAGLDACTPLHVHAAALYTLPDSLCTICWGCQFAVVRSSLNHRASSHARNIISNADCTNTSTGTVCYCFEACRQQFWSVSCKSSSRLTAAPQQRPHRSSTTDPQILNRSNPSLRTTTACCRRYFQYLNRLLSHIAAGAI